MARALIVGGHGFIGCCLAERLLDDGWSVVTLDPAKPVMDLTHERLERSTNNATDKRSMEFQVSSADCVFHLAAHVGVDRTYGHVAHTIQEHLEIDHNVFEACLNYKKPVLYTSTSEVYGKNPNIPWREDADCCLGPSSRGRWSYAASKLIGEHLALAMHRDYDLNVRIVRLFNITGGGQSNRFVLPRFAQQAIKGEPLTIYGSGEQRRTFCSVNDCVDALVKLMIPRANGEIINVGTQREITVNSLAKMVLSYNKGGTFKHIPYYDAYGADFDDVSGRVPNLEKIRLLIGWEPLIPLEWIVQGVLVHERGQIKV